MIPCLRPNTPSATRSSNSSSTLSSPPVATNAFIEARGFWRFMFSSSLLAAWLSCGAVTRSLPTLATRSPPPPPPELRILATSPAANAMAMSTRTARAMPTPIPELMILRRNWIIGGSLAGLSGIVECG